MANYIHHTDNKASSYAVTRTSWPSTHQSILIQTLPSTTFYVQYKKDEQTVQPQAIYHSIIIISPIYIAPFAIRFRGDQTQRLTTTSHEDRYIEVRGGALHQVNNTGIQRHVNHYNLKFLQIMLWHCRTRTYRFINKYRTIKTTRDELKVNNRLKKISWQEREHPGRYQHGTRHWSHVCNCFHEQKTD